MRRILFGLSALLLTAAAPAAQACINDREVDRTEREFKSQYLRPAPSISEPQPAPENRTPSVVFLGGGVVLLLGAAVTVLNVRRRP